MLPIILRLVESFVSSICHTTVSCLQVVEYRAVERVRSTIPFQPDDVPFEVLAHANFFQGRYVLKKNTVKKRLKACKRRLITFRQTLTVEYACSRTLDHYFFSTPLILIIFAHVPKKKPEATFKVDRRRVGENGFHITKID
jgi:hypothetical protein